MLQYREFLWEKYPQELEKLRSCINKTRYDISSLLEMLVWAKDGQDIQDPIASQMYSLMRENPKNESYLKEFLSWEYEVFPELLFEAIFLLSDNLANGLFEAFCKESDFSLQLGSEYSEEHKVFTPYHRFDFSFPFFQDSLEKLEKIRVFENKASQEWKLFFKVSFSETGKSKKWWFLKTYLKTCKKEMHNEIKRFDEVFFWNFYDVINSALEEGIYDFEYKVVPINQDITPFIFYFAYNVSYFEYYKQLLVLWEKRREYLHKNNLVWVKSRVVLTPTNQKDTYEDETDESISKKLKPVFTSLSPYYEELESHIVSFLEEYDNLIIQLQCPVKGTYKTLKYPISWPILSTKENLHILTKLMRRVQNYPPYSLAFSIETWTPKQSHTSIKDTPMVEASAFNTLRNTDTEVEKKLGRLEYIFDPREYGLIQVCNILKTALDIISIKSWSRQVNQLKAPLLFECILFLEQTGTSIIDLVYFFNEKFSEIDKNSLSLEEIFFYLWGRVSDIMQQILEREFLELNSNLKANDTFASLITFGLDGKLTEEAYDIFLDLFLGTDTFSLWYEIIAPMQWIESKDLREWAGYFTFTPPFYTIKNYKKIQELNDMVLKVLHSPCHIIHIYISKGEIDKQTQEFPQLRKEISLPLKEKDTIRDKKTLDLISWLIEKLKKQSYSREEILKLVTSMERLSKNGMSLMMNTKLSEHPTLKEMTLHIISQCQWDVKGILDILEDNFPGSFLDLPLNIDYQWLENKFIDILYRISCVQDDLYIVNEKDVWRMAISIFCTENRWV